MVNYTEKWKKGELPKGYYYAEDDGEELIIHIQGKNGSVMGDDFDLKATDWIKPIAPVPSLEQWQQMKAFCEEFNALNVAEENQKLKSLLKEWMHFYPIILYEHEDTLKTKDIVELYDKTREALK